ncbi:outer membrane beta-barrel protein [Aliikangiella sp. IMCC44359]|uniref:outer membrane beta-barrel protein n=1 Tax=Aliikangiella sp. IMCC44359 TaxID=3459125 RepID=UPI00403AEEDC
MRKFLTVIGCCAVSYSSLASNGSFFVTPQVGDVNTKIKMEYTFENNDNPQLSSDNIEVGVSAGYQFNSDFSIEAVLLRNDTADVFEMGDTYNIDQKQLMLGYTFKVNQHFQIVPKIGISYWEFDGKEGSFLNPGPEEESHFSGSELVWKLAFEIPINNLIQLQLTYSDNNYDFGKAQTTSFGVKFEF